MFSRSNRAKRGLTLIELMVTVLAAMVLLVGISTMLYHGHIGYRRLFNRVNSRVVRNAYEARRTFDRLVRKSSIRRCDLADGNNTVYVYYFANPQDMLIEDPDRYARFYLSGDQLWLEQGNVTGGFENPGLPTLSPVSNTVIAYDVAAPISGIFSLVPGNAVRMVLILDDETDPEPGDMRIETLRLTVTTEALRHNP